jgi:exodeoxyribonuclease V beta subunit
MKSIVQTIENFSNSQTARHFGRVYHNITNVLFEGYMQGFIDLLFRRGDKYYIVDWKSNHLGNSVLDYDISGMERAMIEHGYILQYHIYAVALHRYLIRRLPGYSPKVNFGGAIYIFLRGVDDSPEVDNGFFFDRISPELISRIDNLIANDSTVNSMSKDR